MKISLLNTKQIFFQKLFPRPLFLNDINFITKLLRVSLHSWEISKNSYNCLQLLLATVIFLKKLNLLRLDLVWAICESTSWNIVLRIWSILSHLREHKLKWSFENLINTLCSCGRNIESTTYFFLYYPLFIDTKMLDNIDAALTNYFLVIGLMI